jgi:hypothetical protein
MAAFLQRYAEEEILDNSTHFRALMFHARLFLYVCVMLRQIICSLVTMWIAENNHSKWFACSLRTKLNILKIFSCYGATTSAQGLIAFMVFTMNADVGSP